MLRRSTRLATRTLIDNVVLKGTSSSSMTSSAPNDFQVIRDETELEFYIIVNNEKARVLYTEVDKETLNLHHTDVPAIFQGRGLGKHLAKGVFDHCVKNHIKMKITCDFLQKIYADNEKEYKKFVIA